MTNAASSVLAMERLVGERSLLNAAVVSQNYSEIGWSFSRSKIGGYQSLRL